MTFLLHLVEYGLLVFFSLCIGTALVIVVIGGGFAICFLGEVVLAAFRDRYRAWRLRRRLRENVMALVEQGDCWDGIDEARRRHPAEIARSEFEDRRAA